jgi:hypothetical protein
MLHLGRLQPYPQTLDKFGKACQGQTLLLIQKFVIYVRKKFYRIGPCCFFVGVQANDSDAATLGITSFAVMTLIIVTLNVITLSITTLVIVSHNLMTLITALSIKRLIKITLIKMTLSKTTLSLMKLDVKTFE